MSFQNKGDRMRFCKGRKDDNGARKVRWDQG